MAHARKGGISHSPGQRFAAPKQRYAPPEWWFAPAGGFFPPPSKIENRRLLIKKNLLNATSIQQVFERKTQSNSKREANQTKDKTNQEIAPKRETDTNANRLEVPDAPKTQPKAIASNQPGRSAIPRQKTPPGGLAAAFSSLAGRKRDYGASRGASESQEKLEKERRSAKSGRKAANRAPNATLNPCSEAPWRRFLPSCEQNRATAASPQRKNLLNATSI